MGTENIFLFNQPIIADEFLLDFIRHCPHPANLKDAQTGRYLLANQSTVEICGFQFEKQLIGLTVREIDGMIQARWGNTYAGVVEDLDQQVKTLRTSAEDKKRIIVENNGFIRVQNMMKIPIANHDKQVTSILTYSCDITKDENLFYLFSVYKKFYSSKRMAIENFLRYLHIDNYFAQNITEAELLVLLGMKYNQLYKEVAQKLGIQTKTVEIHAGNLRNKMKNGGLHRVLEKLRA